MRILGEELARLDCFPTRTLADVQSGWKENRSWGLTQGGVSQPGRARSPPEPMFKGRVGCRGSGAGAQGSGLLTRFSDDTEPPGLRERVHSPSPGSQGGGDTALSLCCSPAPDSQKWVQSRTEGAQGVCEQ